MVIIKQIETTLLLFASDQVHVLNLVNKNEKKLQVPPPILPSNLTKSQESVVTTSNRIITSAALSREGHVAVILQNKQLVIYNSNFEVIKNVITSRAASNIQFTPNGTGLILADKTGDVYLYKFSDEEPEMILGHLSMLLDVCFTPCGKFVITCDRDEKIRASHFPNAYNILSYCLGHTEFVVHIKVVNDVLISGSGDGTIRFWDLNCGKQLYIINTNEFISDKTVIERFCKQMQDENVEVNALPITNVEISVHNSIVYIAASILNVNELLIFSGSLSEKLVSVNLMQKLVFQENVTSFSLDQELFVFINEKLLMYELVNKETFVECTNRYVEFFEYVLSRIENTDCNDILSLYKRRFDNVQEYLERKKLRLENK